MSKHAEICLCPFTLATTLILDQEIAIFLDNMLLANEGNSKPAYFSSIFLPCIICFLVMSYTERLTEGLRVCSRSSELFSLLDCNAIETSPGPHPRP